MVIYKSDLINVYLGLGLAVCGVRCADVRNDMRLHNLFLHILVTYFMTRNIAVPQFIAMVYGVN